MVQLALLFLFGCGEPNLHVRVHGQGLVQSEQIGLSCETQCWVAQPEMTVLTAAPKANWMFLGWSGACQGLGSCLLPGGAERVDAVFEPSQVLQIGLQGPGRGRVIGGQSVNCDSDCGVQVAAGRSVELNAVWEDGYVFLGWSGACQGLGPCRFVLQEGSTVRARFGLAPGEPLAYYHADSVGRVVGLRPEAGERVVLEQEQEPDRSLEPVWRSKHGVIYSEDDAASPSISLKKHVSWPENVVAAPGYSDASVDGLGRVWTVGTLQQGNLHALFGQGQVLPSRECGSTVGYVARWGRGGVEALNFLAAGVDAIELRGADIFVMGRFSGEFRVGQTSVFGGGEPGCASGEEAFVARFDALGGPVWFRTWESVHPRRGEALVLDSDRTVYGLSRGPGGAELMRWVY